MATSLSKINHHVELCLVFLIVMYEEKDKVLQKMFGLINTYKIQSTGIESNNSVKYSWFYL